MRCGAARCSEVRCEDESGVSKQELPGRNEREQVVVSDQGTSPY